ncbi:MAG: hypothetical protein LBI03_03135 [Clostridiales bacterium]|jgi:hypothetical protein|nr:hypothetical protein [Clostridiales bacterium]
MNITSFKEITEVKANKFADSPLGKMSEEFLKKPESDTPRWEKSDTSETKEDNTFRGGSYGDLKEAGYGWPDHEVHHMPAASVSELPREDGPAIVMDREDHKETASFGNSREAQEYRAEQKELIEQGKFNDALQMDIDDIHDKFGDKYDDVIAEVKQYANKLEEEGRV